MLLTFLWRGSRYCPVWNTSHPKHLHIHGLLARLCIGHPEQASPRVAEEQFDTHRMYELGICMVVSHIHLALPSFCQPVILTQLSNKSSIIQDDVGDIGA